MKQELISIYKILLNHFGPQGWWPADDEFEVIIGAILTQATSWKNVEKSIDNLKNERVLNPSGLYKISTKKLAGLIRPSLYYNVKAKKLKSFVNFLYKEYDGNLNLMLSQANEKLRTQLLDIWGIGPETADSILLYAANKKTFVIDAYTRRIFYRLGFIGKNSSYDEIKNFFEGNLPKRVKLYKEYHALIVKLGKDYCKKEPLCKECPVRKLCKISLINLPSSSPIQPFPYTLSL